LKIFLKHFFLIFRRRQQEIKEQEKLKQEQERQMLEQERLELEQERLELEEKVRKQDQELLLVKQVRVDFFYISEVKMFILLIPL